VASYCGCVRNRTILERLGCLDEAGMVKLRNGKAPTITKGPYAAGDTRPPDISPDADIASADHIIPRSVCPELDNCIFNLEFMPGRMNSGKGAKITDRQVQLADQWHDDGLLSPRGLEGFGCAAFARILSI